MFGMTCTTPSKNLAEQPHPPWPHPAKTFFASPVVQVVHAARLGLSVPSQ